MSRPTVPRASGFSLIELMIAMVLGLVLIGGSIAVFSANVRSAELGQAVASLQAGARFALDTMARDLRSAGFRGCAAAETSVLNVAIAGADDGLFRGDVLGGSRVTATGWEPAPPGGYQPPSTGGGAAPPAVPAPGTHALVVQYAAAPGTPLSISMLTPNDSLTLDGSDAALVDDGFALVSDCESADVFRIATLGGNAESQTVSPTEALLKRYRVRADFPGSTRVYPLVGAIYFIGDTGRDNAAGDDVRALYLQSLPYDAASNPPVELLEGVEQLQLTFGTTDATGTVRLLAPEHADVAPNDVDVVEVALLMQSIEPLLDAPSTRVFHLAGREVGPRTGTTAADTPAYEVDRRLRVPYAKTVRLRNRNL